MTDKKPEIGVRYADPDRAWLKAMWYLHDMGRVEGIDRRMIIEVNLGLGEVKHLDVYGFGGMLGGWDENGSVVQDIPVEAVVAATLVDRS